MNLLLDSLLSIASTDATTRRLNLPELFVELAADRVAGFPYLRPHQQPAWHMFLVQLATLASREMAGERPASAEQWRDALRQLSRRDDDSAWSLVVDDWAIPAFLQPPIQCDADREDYKRCYRTADALDVLITGRNHDLKGQRMQQSAPEEWLYALLTLQTTEGFLGAGNYGIARMNGGFASRPMLRCATTAMGLGAQVFRDVEVLLQQFERLNERAAELEVGVKSPRHALLWLLPWNGTESLSLKHFHPLAIEVCRRVRLTARAGSLAAVSAGSKSARVQAKDACGVVGDPWAPIKLEGNKSFTATAQGLGYRQMVELLDRSRFTRPLLAEATKAEARGHGPMAIYAAALARGQGKTEGFHWRSVILSPSSSARFAADEPSFSERSARFVALAGDASGKALRPALVQLLQGKEKPDWKKPSNDALVEPWLRQFDEQIDREFFAELSRSFDAELSDEAAERAFSALLERAAQNVFEQAVNASPRTDQVRVLGVARAQLLLTSSLRKHLPLTRPAEENIDV